LQEAWKLLFGAGLPLASSVGRVRESLGSVSVVEELLTFIGASQRGVCQAAAPEGRTG
jgi:acyl-[acyl carrier protein]--UDP-N-acetylglucosamine O-acyltransferase